MTTGWRFSPDELIACALGSPSPAGAALEPLERILALLYQASLCAEEQQPVRLTALLLPPGTPVPPLARFTQRLPLTVQRLRKLAPAFDPAQTVLLVEQGPTWALTGVASRRTVASLAQVPQGAWLVEVRGVAELHLRHARGEAVFARSACYRPDEPDDLASLIPPVLTDPVAGEAVRRARAILAEQNAREGGAAARWALAGDPRAVVPRELARRLKELALAVRRIRCGGAFLLLADEGFDLGEVVDSLHRLEGGRAESAEEPWSGRLLDALALRLLSSHAEDHLLCLAEADAAAQEEIQRTACLARIDGAVILDRGLEPIAVGAKLRTDTYDALSLTLTRWLLESEKGTRHKALACAVAASAGALGLVVSADGEITLFANPEGRGVRERVVRA